MAVLTPHYDAERFGVILCGSPRHSDVLMATGPITFQAKDRVLRIYEQMPDPKFVIAIGECACSSGVFKNCYGIKGGIDTLIPVDVYIPGCPPRPEAILDGVVKLTEKLKES